MGRQPAHISRLSPMALLVVVAALLVCSPRFAEAQAEILRAAIVKANAAGASGPATKVVLTSNVLLDDPLPELSGAARLTIVGGCRNDQGQASRCIISGGDHLPIFSSPLSGPTSGWLRLSYLQLQRAQGGVFDRMRTAINASRCVFVGNTAGGMGGAVLIDMFPSSSSSSSSSPPARSFSDCAFQSNLAPLLGGAVANVNSGNPLARAPSLLFLRCSFRGNEAPRSLGGAIAVAGAGRMRLQGCVFEGNTAGASGGAIFSYGTSLAIAFTAFRNNKALGTAPGGSFTTGAGGAAFVISGLTGRPTAAAFCSASFSGNTGAVASGGSVFFQKAPGNSPLGATVTFCGGSRPSSGLFLPKNGWAVGKTCSPTTCK